MPHKTFTDPTMNLVFFLSFYIVSLQLYYLTGITYTRAVSLIYQPKLQQEQPFGLFSCSLRLKMQLWSSADAAAPELQWCTDANTDDALLFRGSQADGPAMVLDFYLVKVNKNTWSKFLKITNAFSKKSFKNAHCQHSPCKLQKCRIFSNL